MQIKKTTLIAVFISAIFVSASFMVAQAYEPLVRLPGLPLTGDISLSQYVVGLYNFLLSIVGIVAVMMLIIGGMKYITAAGNASIIGDAKDTISNAIFGLLLALLSWVIVSTINPDVLYIKNPASNLGSVYENDFACGTYNTAGPSCLCRDGSSPIAANEAQCDAACADPISCELEIPFPCIGGGLKDNNPVNGKCSCVDGNSEVVINYGVPPKAPDDAKCNEVCSNPDWAVGGKYHGINWRLKVGHDIEGRTIDERENFPLTAEKLAYFNLSEIRDCKDNLVHLAIEFEPPIINIAPDKWCCMKYNTGCNGTWGVCCNNDGIGDVWDLGCPGALALPGIPPTPIPLCNLALVDSYEDYPVYTHTYDSIFIGHISKFWIGGSVSTGGTECMEITKNFNIEIEA